MADLADSQAAARQHGRTAATVVLLLLWAWASTSILTSTLIVQDECHFFDPVYELVDHGKWRGPHNEYLGHGIEKLQYGHPMANGLLQAPWLVLTGSGWWAVRITAVLLRLVAVGCVLAWMRRGLLSPAAAVVAALLFLFFSYATQSVVRPDLPAGLCLLGMLWQLRADPTWRQVWVMALFWALAGWFHQFAIIAGGAGWAYAVASLLVARQFGPARRLTVGAFAAGAIFLALFILPIALLHGFSSIPDLLNGTRYHINVISEAPGIAEIVRRMIRNYPHFTLVLALSGWILWPRSGFSFTERCMAAAFAGGYGYLAVKTNFTTWYFVTLSLVAAYLFGRCMTLLLPQWPRAVRAGVGVALALLVVFTCRHGLIGTTYSNVVNGRAMDRLLQSLVDQYIPADSSVLTTPQFYHYLRHHCAMTRDLEYLVNYGRFEDLSRFDFVTCMDEQDTGGALHRLSDKQREALSEQFDVIYDSKVADVRWHSNHIRSFGKLVPIPQILIFARKQAGAAAAGANAPDK